MDHLEEWNVHGTEEEKGVVCECRFRLGTGEGGRTRIAGNCDAIDFSRFRRNFHCLLIDSPTEGVKCVEGNQVIRWIFLVVVVGFRWQMIDLRSGGKEKTVTTCNSTAREGGKEEARWLGVGE